MRGAARRERRQEPTQEATEDRVVPEPFNQPSQNLETTILDQTRPGEDPPPGRGPPPGSRIEEGLEGHPIDMSQREEITERSLTPNAGRQEPISSPPEDIEDSRPRRYTRQPARYPDYEYLYIQDPHHSKEIEESLHFPEVKKDRWEGSYTSCTRINQDSLDLLSAG